MFGVVLAADFCVFNVCIQGNNLYTCHFLGDKIRKINNSQKKYARYELHSAESSGNKCGSYF